MKTTKTYNGKPCKKCGSNYRYLSTCACVSCAIKNQLTKHYANMGKIFTGVELSEQQISVLNREEAKENGKRYYHGMKCRNCDSTQKYVSTRACVSCTNTRAKNVQQKRKIQESQITGCGL